MYSRMRIFDAISWLYNHIQMPSHSSDSADVRLVTALLCVFAIAEGTQATLLTRQRIMEAKLSQQMADELESGYVLDPAMTQSPHSSGTQQSGSASSQDSSGPDLGSGDDDAEEDEALDADLQAATPAYMKHYWKQVEKAILTAPRGPFSEDVPASTTGLSTIPELSEFCRMASNPCACGKTGVLRLQVQGCFCYDEIPAALSKPAASTPLRQMAASGKLTWEALFLVWSGAVEYTVSLREVRRLLMDASLPSFLIPAITFGGSLTSFDLSSANLCMLWFFTSLRRVYEAMIVNGDVNRADAEMSEIKNFAAPLYKKYIRRWPACEDMGVASDVTALHRKLRFLCVVRGCWVVLEKLHKDFKRIRFQLSLSSLGHLGRYFYSSSVFRYASAALIAMMTALSSRVNAAGRSMRGTIQKSIEKAKDVESSNESSAGTATNQELSLLIAFELSRLTVNYIILHTTNEFIHITASHRRDAVKSELIEAFANTPLPFFDMHTFDEVEEIIYYVDDMEGIEVQLHQYVFSTANTLWALKDILRGAEKKRMVLLAVATAALPHAIQYIGKRVREAYSQFLRAGVFPWREVIVDDDEEPPEDTGVFLQGVDVISAVHQLRPYGADARLACWWNHDQCAWPLPRKQQHSTVLQNTRHPTILGPVRLLLGLPYGKMVPGAGKGIIDLAVWLLPLALAAYGARWLGLTAEDCLRLVDLTTASEGVVDIVVESVDLSQMAMENAFKASVLERVRNPRYWEVRSAVDLPMIYQSASRQQQALRAEKLGRQDSLVFFSPALTPAASMSDFSSQPLAGSFEADATAYSFKGLTIQAIHLDRIQFRYPAVPNMYALAAPLTMSITLYDTRTQKGRFVCLTGPSGCGKSTLLQLLLGLYTQYAPPNAPGTINVELAACPRSRNLRRTRSVMESPPRPPRHDMAFSRSHTGAVMAMCASPDAESAPAAAMGSLNGCTVPLREVPVNILRGRWFSYVPQVPSIFQGATVAQNVSLAGYVSVASDHILRRVSRCMELAQCADLVEKLPAGLMTRISDSSTGWHSGGADGRGVVVRLSPDQIQRLMIARALYQGGHILLMDEPTANVSPDTVRALCEQWRALLKDRVLKGILCVTHDATLLAAADEVITVG